MSTLNAFNHIALLALLGLAIFAALMVTCTSQVLAPAAPIPAIPAAATRPTTPLIIPLGKTTIEFVSIQGNDGSPGTCDACHIEDPAQNRLEQKSY